MSVYAVIVTYCPDVKQFNDCVKSIVSQVDKIVVVKNSVEHINVSYANVEVVQLDKNYGIAYAQNCGIKYALNQKANYILLSDQDTVYPPEYITTLRATCDKYNEHKIAACVPLFYNENKKQFSQVMISKTKAIVPVIGRDYILSHAISSGSLCPAYVFTSVGLMNERLFIDWVDTEWCWRANRKGYKIICNTRIIISHSMGDNYKTVLGKKIVVYSNFRNYFFFRNGFYLLFHSKLLNIREYIYFFNYMFIKSLLFFLTKGCALKNIKLFLSALKKGVTNHYALEDAIQ